VIESRIAADKNCHFLLHVLPFFFYFGAAIFPRRSWANWDQIFPCHCANRAACNGQCGDSMCVCFFLGWEPQKLDDSLNRKSESKHFRKNSVICIVCLLKLCIQSWRAQTKGPINFEFNLWVWFWVPGSASTTVVLSISFTDHGVVCNGGAKLWYVVSRCWTETESGDNHSTCRVALWTLKYLWSIQLFCL